MRQPVNQQRPHVPQPIPQTPPPKPKRRWRFRWQILLVPLACLFAAWMASGIEIGFSWDDIMDRISVVHRGAYSRLFLLGLMGVAIAAIVRITRNTKEEN